MTRIVKNPDNCDAVTSQATLWGICQQSRHTSSPMGGGGGGGASDPFVCKISEINFRILKINYARASERGIYFVD